jgi:hypothetical protein
VTGGYVWNAPVDTAVDAAIAEVLAEFPGSQISVREVQDDRGVVSIVVTAGDGRLVVAARSVDLVPVEWPFAFADGVVGVLPRREFPTVDELAQALMAVGR